MFGISPDALLDGDLTLTIAGERVDLLAQPGRGMTEWDASGYQGIAVLQEAIGNEQIARRRAPFDPQRIEAHRAALAGAVAEQRLETASEGSAVLLTGITQFVIDRTRTLFGPAAGAATEADRVAPLVIAGFVLGCGLSAFATDWIGIASLVMPAAVLLSWVLRMPLRPTGSD